MKISEYKLNKFDPDSRGELITTVYCKHYGFECEGKVYTSVGELDEDYIVSAMIKIICKWTDKEGYSRTTTFYDSTFKEFTEESIKEFIEFELKCLYTMYRDGK